MSSSKPLWRLVRVTLDDAEHDWHVLAYWDGQEWNGFVEPGFTVDALREISRRYPELVQVQDDGTALVCDEVDGKAILAPATIETEAGPRALHFFPGWCWYLAAANDNIQEMV
ncbi:hypothetical protein FX016_22975 [Cupriavidus gilardii]|nr:hypothetical protein FX016_22975 [Cupriavidus gilardii]